MEATLPLPAFTVLTVGVMSVQREIVGPGPSDDVLKRLLSDNNYNVTAAANAYFDGQSATHRFDQQPEQLMQVTVPEGKRGGQELRFTAPSGESMRVTIPRCLRPGDVFLVRPPPHAPVAHAIPIGARRTSSYPAAGQQPNVIYVQQPVVYNQPRYRRGYDPMLSAGVGFLGGVLIADALFW